MNSSKKKTEKNNRNRNTYEQELKKSINELLSSNVNIDDKGKISILEESLRSAIKKAFDEKIEDLVNCIREFNVDPEEIVNAINQRMNDGSSTAGARPRRKVRKKYRARPKYKKFHEGNCVYWSGKGKPPIAFNEDKENNDMEKYLMSNEEVNNYIKNNPDMGYKPINS